MKEITAYLNFNGNCREAMEFYKKGLGGELYIMPFSEMPDLPKEAKQAGDRIMHACLSNGNVKLMASDTMPGDAFQQGNNVYVCMACDSAEEIEKVFKALSEKGKVTMPVQETFWAERFGMLTDQFGIHWMFNLEKPKEKQ